MDNDVGQGIDGLGNTSGYPEEEQDLNEPPYYADDKQDYPSGALPDDAEEVAQLEDNQPNTQPGPLNDE